MSRFRSITGYRISKHNKFFELSMSISVNYTNSFDATKVLAVLKGRLAWRQPTIANAPVLSDQNKTSKTGRFFNDFHALANIVNIKNTQEDADITDDAFNTYLQSLYDSVIFRVLSAVFGLRSIIDDGLVYQRVSPSVDVTVNNTGKFCGYVIDISSNSNRAVQLQNVTLKFDSIATFNLYLFADGNPNEIWSTEVTTVANVPTVFELESVILNYLASGTRATRFFFGYFQQDLGATKAISEQAMLSDNACFAMWPVMMNVLNASIDFSQVIMNSLPYGINIEATSFRDDTNAIIRNASLFDDFIGLQMAASVIENIMHSNRSNGDERIMKDSIDKLMVYMDLKGTVPISDAPSSNGIAKQIEREAVKLRRTFLYKPASRVVNPDACS
jgi:hypothetical protein